MWTDDTPSTKKQQMLTSHLQHRPGLGSITFNKLFLPKSWAEDSGDEGMGAHCMALCGQTHQDRHRTDVVVPLCPVVLVN